MGCDKNGTGLAVQDLIGAGRGAAQLLLAPL